MKTLIWCGTVVLTAIRSPIAWLLHGLVGMAAAVIESTNGIIPVDPVLSSRRVLPRRDPRVTGSTHEDRIHRGHGPLQRHCTLA